jgi:ABC-2 type transport system ATP-binding protein
MAFATPTDQSQFQPINVKEQTIITRGLTKRFGNQVAVQDVTFTVPRGTIFGYIGPSGSGKTTTIRMLTGVYIPTEGEVLVLGKHPTRFSQGKRAKIGYMPQLFVLYPHLTVWENLNFAASLYGMSPFRKKELREVLDFVELSNDTSKLARNISGGMQRRLSLATTLIHNPELIFLDEPTAGIDPILRKKFWDHFQELKSQDRTLFITTQYVNEAAFCDLVGVMGNNRLIAVDTPDRLRYLAYGGEVIDMRLEKPITLQQEQELHQLPFIKGDIKRTSEDSIRLTVENASTAIPDIIEWSRNKNISVEAVEKYLPPFEEVFVQLVKDQEDSNA